jgi:hypothetical protein
VSGFINPVIGSTLKTTHIQPGVAVGTVVRVVAHTEEAAEALLLLTMPLPLQLP